MYMHSHLEWAALVFQSHPSNGVKQGGVFGSSRDDAKHAVRLRQQTFKIVSLKTPE